jgi:hypothetical protein
MPRNYHIERWIAFYGAAAHRIKKQQYELGIGYLFRVLSPKMQAELLKARYDPALSSR